MMISNPHVRVLLIALVAACGGGSGIHLFRTAALAAPDNLITQLSRQLIGAVSARAINDNNFRPTSSLAQIRKKTAYRRRLIKDRNNNRDLHQKFWSKINGCSICLLDE